MTEKEILRIFTSEGHIGLGDLYNDKREIDPTISLKIYGDKMRCKNENN